VATHDFGQDQHAPSVVDMLDMTEGLDQRSQNYTSPLTDLKGRDRGESPLALASGDQRLDHATWHGDRLFSAHDQRCEGALLTECQWSPERSKMTKI
jgi:hypothetical protein